MFNTTWQGYGITLALFPACYYFAIFLLHYRKDVKPDFTGRTLVPAAGSFSPGHFTLLPFSPDRKEKSASSATVAKQSAYACIDELAAYFVESKRIKCVKQELLFVVQRILSKPPSLRYSEFQEAITNVIASEAKQRCSIQLKEMRRVWLLQNAGAATRYCLLRCWLLKIFKLNLLFYTSRKACKQSLPIEESVLSQATWK